MTPLMQTIFEELCGYGLDPYIDGFVRDTYDEELEQLYNALSAVLPEHCRTIFERYALIARARSLVELVAMFQAAYAAARELA